jgi:hypothetical protein
VVDERDKTSRHRRAQTATDRDLQGIRAAKERANAPALGVPILTEDADSDFTPVADVLSHIRNPEIREAVAAIWRHTANIEMRSRARHIDDTDAVIIREDLAALRADVVDIKGTSGTNGRLGTLSAAIVEVADKVKTINSRAWWAFTVIVGGIGAAIVKLILVGMAYGEMHTTLDANRVEIAAQRAELVQLRTALFTRLIPALAPGKETTP